MKQIIILIGIMILLVGCVKETVEVEKEIILDKHHYRYIYVHYEDTIEEEGIIKENGWEESGLSYNR